MYRLTGSRPVLFGTVCSALMAVIGGTANPPTMAAQGAITLGVMGFVIGGFVGIIWGMRR